jgi:phage/plasmid-like protein (TIGR03299 family)
MTYTLPTLSAPSNYDVTEKSRETMEWLRQHILIGYVDQRGPAWWSAATTKDGVWTMPKESHFPGAVPLKRVTKLLDVQLVKGTSYVKYLDEQGNEQVVQDTDNIPVVNASTGRIFGYPKDGYAIHPYLSTLKGFMENILHDETIAVSSAGLLRGGGVAFLQIVLPEHYEVQGFGYVPYMMAVTSADRTRKTSYSTGIKAGICDNTVDAALLAAYTKVAIRHSRNSFLKVEDARNTLGIQLAEVADNVALGIEALMKIDVSDREYAKWKDLTAPLPEYKESKAGTGGKGYTMAESRRDAMDALWFHDEKVKPWAGTAFGILQLDNTFRTFEGLVRGMQGGRMERNFTQDVQGKSAAADKLALQRLATVKRRKTLIAA